MCFDVICPCKSRAKAHIVFYPIPGVLQETSVFLCSKSLICPILECLESGYLFAIFFNCSCASSDLFSPREKVALDFAVKAASVPNGVSDEDIERMREH